MNITCAIIDDEPLALDLLETYVKRTPFLTLKGRCNSGAELIGLLTQESIDVVFMDIQMPELNGLEVSRLLGNHTKVVFVTAFEQYALEGFKVDAMDYLLKPVSYPEFMRAAQKVFQWYEMVRKGASERLTEKEECIFVKSEYKLVRINLSDILYIEGLKDYVKIYLENVSQPILSLMSMKTLEDMLPEGDFIRVHRSFIVRMDKIKVVERNRIVFGKEYIPVSDSYKAKFAEYLNGKTVS